MNSSKKEYSPSKIALLAILELLKDGSSADKPLTIKQIVDLLKLRYDYSISRNTVKDSLDKLKYFRWI